MKSELYKPLPDKQVGNSRIGKADIFPNFVTRIIRYSAILPIALCSKPLDDIACYRPMLPVWLTGMFLESMPNCFGDTSMIFHINLARETRCSW